VPTGYQLTFRFPQLVRRHTNFLQRLEKGRESLIGFLAVGIASHAAIAIENARLYKAAQEESCSKELLLKEFKHRIKNTLATVQAIAGQTLRSSPQSERDVFRARLQVLAHAHDLLTDRDWQQAAVRDLVQGALAPFEQDRLRHRVRGRIVRLATGIRAPSS
jgi:hypothetical protein